MRVAALVVIAFGILVAGIVANSYINRGKDPVPSAEEIFTSECSRRGGNPVTRVGWDDAIHVQEYKCEGVSDVRN